MKDCALILSGGMDSVTLLHYRKEDIALAISFDYGSNHNAREIECARIQCISLKIPHIVIPLAFMHDYFKSALLSGADFIPEGNYAEDNITSTVVPFRNGIMLSIACGIAESYGLKKVMMANHGGDHTIYPDCRPEFVKAMDEAMKAGTYAGISLEAPFTNLDKTQIAKLGRDLGVDYSKTYSCYKGREKHCGKCATCIERKEALRNAKIDDPTVYEE